MGKKVEVSYNPQLGYLQTIFHHNFDFLTGIKSYTERTDGVEFVVDTYKENTVKVFIQCVGETAFRFRMYTPGNEQPFDNSIYQLEGQNGVNITENEEFISISKGKIEARVRKYPWEVSYYLDGKLKTKEQIKDSNVDNMCKNLPVGFTKYLMLSLKRANTLSSNWAFTLGIKMLSTSSRILSSIASSSSSPFDFLMKSSC